VTEVRNLAKYAVLARSAGHLDVAICCTKLLTCTECPQIDNSGFFTCSLTKVQALGGIPVNSSADAVPIHVHPKFLRFCVSYWFASRFEHVMRKLVRARYPKSFCDEHTLAFITTAIHNDATINTKIVDNFVNSLVHIHKTMKHLLCTHGDAAYTLSSFIIEDDP
ncbi:hypothetical protein T484DRAFT_1757654, partial [Baffinella frigidus]